MNRIAAVVAGLSLAFVGTSATVAATINVPADQPTIAAAISASVNGDVINIAAGNYTEYHLNPGGKAITIQGTLNGDGSLATTIDAQQGGSVFVINSGEGDETVIRDLVITGGYANFGAGISIRNSSRPTISGCTISGNTSNFGDGGGIFCGSNVTISDCTISNNTGGGIYCEGSNSTISDCTISNNTAPDGGGILCAGSNLTIRGCTITGNTASSNGGGIRCVYGSNPTISDCTISNNTAPDGGGIYCRYSSSPTISGCIIAHNAASSKGGGIMADNYSNPSVVGCTFTSNSSNVSGGAMYAEYNSTVFADNNCTFIGNTAGYQGGVAMANNSAGFYIYSSTMSLNVALEGGAIYCSSNSFLLVSNCRISSNIATGYPESDCFGCPAGGGISHRNNASLIIDGSRLCGNQPDNIAGNYLADGAAISDTCIIFECRDEDCDGDYDGDDVRIAMANFGITEGTPGDMDGDGDVDVKDLDSLHASLGICPHDINHDGDTDIGDLLSFLAGYGATCP